MEKTSLSDYAQINGQSQTAKELQLTQGAVSKAIRCGRNIFVFKKEGKLCAEEIRPFPVARS